ncbi:hypothetical protein PEC301937_30320 [Pectobacterium carotovorum subsp. carotovorum]|nr:hypothetical protein PEC301937_30320 [Pectobacterium carotovorum subsp. carotovorum]
MTDKTGLLVVPHFNASLRAGTLNLFGSFPEPAFLFRKPYLPAEGIINVNRLINEESVVLMLKM